MLKREFEELVKSRVTNEAWSIIENDYLKSPFDKYTYLKSSRDFINKILTLSDAQVRLFYDLIKNDLDWARKYYNIACNGDKIIFIDNYNLYLKVIKILYRGLDVKLFQSESAEDFINNYYI